MPRLFLHIGSHKTGTTAVQQGMHQNRILLQALGITYVGTGNIAHIHSAIGAVTPASFLPDGYMVLDPDELAARLAAAQTETVVASSENFSFFFDKTAIATLAEALRPLFNQIHIVCYLRRQDRHAVSHHQEGAKPYRRAEGALWGHAPTALPEYSTAHDLYLDYNRRLGMWADVFGDAAMTIRIYDRNLLKKRDIFADFLDILGLDITGLQPVGERNISLGAAQSKAGHLMNSLEVRGNSADAILARIEGGGRLLPSQAEARAYLDRYTASNRLLNQRFQISPAPDLFNDDFSDYPASSQSDWTEDGANAALLAVLQHLVDVYNPTSAPNADDFRTAAAALKNTDREMARRLINAAYALRPNGAAIQKLKAQLDAQVEPSIPRNAP